MAGSLNEPGLASTASFGYWVRRRRLALDLTQAALARRVGCSTVTIKKIEHDERRPSRTMAGRLADALQVTDTERERFVAVGLGEVSPTRVALTSEPVGSAPGHVGPAPAWLSEPAAPSSGSGFVGRARELARLDRHLTATLGGQGRVAFVVGEAGQGKTAPARSTSVRATSPGWSSWIPKAASSAC